MIPLQYLIEEEQALRIYCDMDGVLTDFVKAMRDIGWTGSLDFNHNEIGKMWRLIDKHGGHEFWASMPWMDGGKELWKYIKDKDPWILTSVGRSLHGGPGRKRKKGKELWVERELGKQYLANMIVVPDKRLKADYAKPNAVLVDDEEQNINDFIRAGGMAIHHKTAHTSVTKLKRSENLMAARRQMNEGVLY